MTHIRMSHFEIYESLISVSLLVSDVPLLLGEHLVVLPAAIVFVSGGVVALAVALVLRVGVISATMVCDWCSLVLGLICALVAVRSLVAGPVSILIMVSEGLVLFPLDFSVVLLALPLSLLVCEVALVVFVVAVNFLIGVIAVTVALMVLSVRLLLELLLALVFPELISLLLLKILIIISSLVVTL